MANPKNKDQPANPPPDNSLESPADAPVSTPTETVLETDGSPSAPPADQAAQSKAPKRSIIRKITESKFLYFYIFMLVMAVCAGIILSTLKWAKNPPAITSKTQKLSAAQLSALAANTTTVGDASQTLNIQSNAVFDGQVLIKQSLDVAGAIKVGGSLTLPAITVGGNGSFGQLQVNNTFSVTGDGVIQGQLNVQKGLTVAGTGSFGSLSASQLSVTSLQLNSDLVISHHLQTAGGNPGRSGGSALGVGGTVSVSGSDTAGTVTINTGSSPPAGCFVTVDFVQKFGSTPHLVVSPSSSASGSLDYYTNRSSTNFSICSASAPSSGSTYVFDYIAVQ